MDRSDCQKRVKASRNALPADHQAAILLLEPGKGALGLKPGHDFFDRSAPVFLGLPDPLRKLRPNPTLAQGLAQGFRIIPFIRRENLQPFTRTPPVTSTDLHRI
jgi:hypothetical protein